MGKLLLVTPGAAICSWEEHQLLITLRMATVASVFQLLQLMLGSNVSIFSDNHHHVPAKHKISSELGLFDFSKCFLRGS